MNLHPHQTDPFGGSQILNDIEQFLRRFIAYPSEEAVVAHTLWVAHAHTMDSWESTPRLAFLSPEPGSGKSRALEVTELLVPRPVHAVNVTPSYLFRKVSDECGRPTILYDEIDTVFGPKAKDNEDVRGMINAGHRRGATAGRCVIRGHKVETEELPAFCAIALAGLNDLPDTIMTRTIPIRMKRRAPTERVEPFRHRLHKSGGETLRDSLTQWIAPHKDALQAAMPQMPEGVEDRNADCWEPLVAVADAAGGDWPERARVAAVALVADLREHRRESLGIRLLADIRSAFNIAECESLTTASLLKTLNASDESPWADLHGKPLDARGLSRRLGNYGIKPKVVRVGTSTPRGYDRADFVDVWKRYLVDSDSTLVAAVEGQNYEVQGEELGVGSELLSPPIPLSGTSATCATSATGQPTEAPNGLLRNLLSGCELCGVQTVTNPCRGCNPTPIPQRVEVAR